MISVDAEWWKGYFDARFLEVYRPLLSAKRTRREAAAVLKLLGLPGGARILDAGCGWGRHSIQLATAGCRVTGVDRAELLLREGRAAGREAQADVAWVNADVRALPFRSVFDAAISLFSSLGYFSSDAEDGVALRSIRDALRPGGAFLLETMHRDRLAREYEERDWWEMDDGTVVRVERDWDAVRGVSLERLVSDGPGGRWEKSHAIRVRSATEWGDLLRAAALEPVAWCGDWRLRRFASTSPHLIVLCRRVDP
jgi:SAM-dependent methyltransferase